jgi:predicted nucleic-acid-binding Zn-ribbon protein
MQATVDYACATGTSYLTNEKNHREEVHMNRMISEAAGVTNRKFIQRSCKRCSGYMEHEMCIDLENDSGYSTCWVLRCVQCGALEYFNDTKVAWGPAAEVHDQV